jgi:hypothetical protein
MDASRNGWTAKPLPSKSESALMRWPYMRQSWTGYCVVRVRSEVNGDHAKADEVTCKRDSKRICAVKEHDALLLDWILDTLAGRDATTDASNSMGSLGLNPGEEAVGR